MWCLRWCLVKVVAASNDDVVCDSFVDVSYAIVYDMCDR